jgi:hypothetical protein
MTGVPSQWEGTGQDKGRKRDGRGFLAMGRNGPGQGKKAGWPGFPHNGKERAETRGKSGMAGVPSQWQGTGREKGEKRDDRGFLTMGRNGPGQRERSAVGVGGCFGSGTGIGIGIRELALHMKQRKTHI